MKLPNFGIKSICLEIQIMGFEYITKIYLSNKRAAQWAALLLGANHLTRNAKRISYAELDCLSIHFLCSLCAKEI